VNRFVIANPESFDQASTLLLDKRYKLPMLKAGGMDVVDHLKEGLIEPDLLVNIKRTSRRVGHLRHRRR
jgi:CO/xanthine dehydrogenase FAD-binding subunit